MEKWQIKHGCENALEDFIDTWESNGLTESEVVACIRRKLREDYTKPKVKKIALKLNINSITQEISLKKK